MDQRSEGIAVNLKTIDLNLSPPTIVEKLNDAKNKKKRGETACIDIFVEMVKIAIFDHFSWFKENIDYFLDEALEIRYQFCNNSSYQPPANFQAIIDFLKNYQELSRAQKRNEEATSQLQRNIDLLMTNSDNQKYDAEKMAKLIFILIPINFVVLLLVVASTLINHILLKDQYFLQGVLPISLVTTFIFGLSIFGYFNADSYLSLARKRAKLDNYTMNTILDFFPSKIHQKIEENADKNRQLSSNENTI